MSKLTQYGHAFQIKALAILITDRDFLQQIADILSPVYFNNDAGKWIMKKTLQYFNEYKTVPNMEVFKVEVEGNEALGTFIIDSLRPMSGVTITSTLIVAR